MNIKLIFIILISLLIQDQPGQIKAEPFEEKDCQNVVNVRGSTNFREFHLVNNAAFVVQDVKELREMKDLQPVKIPVDSFTSSKKRVARKFRKMLKPDRKPYIIMSIARTDLDDFLNSNTDQELKVVINISGVIHEYQVPNTLITCNDSSYLLKGKVDIKLADYGIKPPKMLLGLVKINETVNVDYAYRLKEDDPMFQ